MQSRMTEMQAKLEEATVTGQSGGGLVINSSRGILYAGSGDAFATAARGATLELRTAINAARR